MPTGAHLRKYTQADYALVRRLHDQGLSQGQISIRTGINQGHVGAILLGRVKAAGPAVIALMTSRIGTPAVHEEQPGDTAMLETSSRV
jgi:hypothetical protein